MVATSTPSLPNSTMSQPGGDGQRHSVTPGGRAVPAVLLLAIQETHRKRQDLLRAELRLNNHIEAVYRRLTGLTQMERARLKKKASTAAGHLTDGSHTALARPDDDGEGVQPFGDTLSTGDALATPLALNGEGHRSPDNPAGPANPDGDTASGGDQGSTDAPIANVPADLAAFLAADAAAREWCAELIHGRDYYAAARKPYEKRLERLAKELPVYQWVTGVRGFGALGFAQIVAECGDLSHYANPAKVWKRMGLAVMPDGTRQRKVAGEEAIAHGYSPQRRSIMYVLADSLIKTNGDGEYRAYYLAEKERQRAKLPDAPQAHIHNRALRHLAKRLLKHLWHEWRAASSQMEPSDTVPPADLQAAD
jgi:hypothetical protein